MTKEDFLKPMNKYSNIKKVIGVVSGKGGVGKSLVTSLLASKCAKAGLKVGILDADITGPSIPKSFGITTRAMQDEECLLPTVADGGIKIMSINLLLEDVNSPVVWRGPVISGVIEQFWSDVRWGELDYLFVDMPPGTGDVALTVFQSLPIDGIIIVSTPQDLVKMIVNKAYNMAKMMNVPVLGLVENMSYYICEDCGKKINIFGESKIEETADELNLPVIAKLPINPSINRLVDEGRIFDVTCDEFDDFTAVLKGE
jgi:Mrp family chromosome partitioning ATPase